MKQTDEELTNSDVQNDGSYFSRIPIEYGIHCWCYFSEMIFPTLYEVVFQNSLLILIIIRIQKMIYYVNDQKYYFLPRISLHQNNKKEYQTSEPDSFKSSKWHEYRQSLSPISDMSNSRMQPWKYFVIFSLVIFFWLTLIKYIFAENFEHYELYFLCFWQSSLTHLRYISDTKLRSFIAATK